MRLLNNAPLTHLIRKGLPRTAIGPARAVLGQFQRLKQFEQTLNFLCRCKTLQIVPPFIRNNVHINEDILFPCHRTPAADKLINDLRSLSLNQNIRSLA